MQKNLNMYFNKVEKIKKDSCFLQNKRRGHKKRRSNHCPLFYRNAYEVQALKDSLLEIKQNLSPKNLSKFENDVEVHMQHIQTGNFNVIFYTF